MPIVVIAFSTKLPERIAGGLKDGAEAGVCLSVECRCRVGKLLMTVEDTKRCCGNDGGCVQKTGSKKVFATRFFFELPSARTSEGIPYTESQTTPDADACERRLSSGRQAAPTIPFLTVKILPVQVIDMKIKIWLSIAWSAAIVACNSESILGSKLGVSTDTASPAGVSAGQGLTGPVIPLIDMGSTTYKGFSGGLYPGASSVIPSRHAAVGIKRGKGVARLDRDGNPSADGKYVLLSVGMSNTSNEFCGEDKTTDCDSTTFMYAAAADPTVNHTSLVVVNGAQGGEDASNWDDTTHHTYGVVHKRLQALGVSEKQVQVVWLKEANTGPTAALPSMNADAFRLEQMLGDILRALKVVFPNLKEVFISSRIYGGYALKPLNPEPYAFESGFSVKWIVQAQIDQMDAGRIADKLAGNLDYRTVAPWAAWGPYLWANGTVPRSDGLTWQPEDFRGDGTHPSASGVQKVASALMAFFKSSPQTKCWFLQVGTCE